MPNRNYQKPLVSLIVTTKNNEATIEKCLESLINQNYKNIELLVIDNSSSDKTLEKAHGFTTNIYTKGPERSAQRNFGVEKSLGKYVMIIDSDMELSSNVVAECISIIDDEYTSVIIPEESFGTGFWANCKMLERSFYVGVSWIEAPRFFLKEMYLRAGGYNESLTGGEDWDFFERIKPLSNTRSTTAMILHNEGKLTLGEIIKSRKYYAKGFDTLYLNASQKNSRPSGAQQAVKTFVLFFSDPVKLFKNPVLGVGVLTMKLVEFSTIGLQLIVNRIGTR